MGIKTVEVFRTNLRDEEIANRLMSALVSLDPDLRINFDLEDRERILRIESQKTINPNQVIAIGTALKISIELLMD